MAAATQGRKSGSSAEDGTGPKQDKSDAGVEASVTSVTKVARDVYERSWADHVAGLRLIAVTSSVGVAVVVALIHESPWSVLSALIGLLVALFFLGISWLIISLYERRWRMDAVRFPDALTAWLDATHDLSSRGWTWMDLRNAEIGVQKKVLEGIGAGKDEGTEFLLKGVMGRFAPPPITPQAISYVALVWIVALATVVASLEPAPGEMAYAVWIMCCFLVLAVLVRLPRPSSSTPGHLSAEVGKHGSVPARSGVLLPILQWLFLPSTRPQANPPAGPTRPTPEQVSEEHQ